MINKLVSGIGVYEKGHYVGNVDGAATKEYALWSSMLKRCKVGGSIQTSYPSYVGCSVHPDFIKFQDFAEWCQTQIGFGNPGWTLDKDILIQCNKVYGPDTCAFVPRELNQLLTHKQNNRGEFPTGVSLFKRDGTYRSELRRDGKPVFLGYFETPECAESAYKLAKTAEIHRQSEIWKNQIDPRVYAALQIYKI